MKKITAFLFTISIVLGIRAAGMPFPVHAAEENRKTPQPAPQQPMIAEEAYPAMTDFLSALAIINTHYVNGEKASWKNLFQAALRGLMRELDPFSQYESADTFRNTQEETRGNFAGIGIVIAHLNRGIEIMTVMPGGPSEKAGLKSEDIITEVNGFPVHRKNLNEVIEMMRGEVGTETQLTVYRASDDKQHRFRIKRGIIEVPSVRGTKLIKGMDRIGYIRIVMFGEKTPAEFEKAVNDLLGQGMTALIIDLRDNPGGLLHSAADLCSFFLPEGALIVSLEGRTSTQVTLKAKNGRKFETLPVAILINCNSASASEIVSACLHDHRRAVLVGERSFGKGSVQTLIPFSSKGDALRLTTAKYYTPSRRPIHGRGVDPDITIRLTPAQRSMLSTQINGHPGEIQPLVPNPVRDIQLERAAELLKSLQIFQQVSSPADAQKESKSN